MIGNAAYLENRILAANPIELISILYEHAILYTGKARESLAKRDIRARSAHIARVISIIGELDGCLNHSAGGDFSLNLTRLYQYIRERLVNANLRQEDAPLAEVERLLTTLSEAWAAMPRETPAVASPKYPAPTAEFPVPFIPDAPAYQSNPYQMGNGAASHAWTA
jgi:flagellar secretion chaperone FliS